MKPLKTIVCPVDFSPSSQAALEYALELAAITNSAVHAVHSCNVPHYVRRDMLAWSEGAGKPMSEVAREQAEAAMSELLTAVGKSSPVVPAAHVIIGETKQALLTFAKHHDADLIVLGARGHARLARWIVGGVATRIVREASCPVITVPKEKRRPVSRILAATDFSESAAIALEYASTIAELVGAKIDLLHVGLTNVLLPGELSVGVTPEDTHTWGEIAQREANLELAQTVEAAKSRGVRVNEVLLRFGNPASTMLEVAEDGEYDLIAMGTHGRRGLSHLLVGSVAESVVHHADVPVLTARAASSE